MSNKIGVLPILTILLASVIIISSQSIIAFGQSSPTGVNFLYKFDSSAPGEAGLNMPRGIAVASNGNVYVVDQMADTYDIHVFDSAGKFLFKFGSAGTGDGEFMQPYDIEIDSSNNLYVTDTNNYRIQVFDSAGNFLNKFGTLGNADGQFHTAYSFALDKSNRIYVSDFTNHRIQVFDSSGKFLFKFGSVGTGDGQFSSFESPFGIAVDNSGRIYVVDNGNNRIQVFDSSGKFLFKFGLGDTGSTVYGIDVDSHSNIYLGDFNNYRIQVFDSAGKFLFDFGSAEPNDIGFRPIIVYVDDSDKIYVSKDGKSPFSSNAYDYDVQVFTLDYSTPEPEPSTIPDVDGDGITDVVDECINQAETMNGFEDLDGCPDVIPLKDTDEDGIADSLDKCPTQVETFNSFQDEDGCPDTVLNTQPTPQPEQKYGINVLTDKSSYDKGEIIKVSGEVINSGLGTEVGLTIIGPGPFNNIVTVDQLQIGSDGKYKTTLSTATDSWAFGGTYTIKVTYGSQQFYDKVTINLQVSDTPTSIPSTQPISVYTDRSSYSSGDVIGIYGQVRDLLSGTPVSLQVFTADGNLVTIEQIDVGTDHKFSKEVTDNTLWSSSGTYTIKVLYGTKSLSAETTFAFSSGHIEQDSPYGETTTPNEPESEQKITICHIPPGNPTSAHTFRISQSAWSAHQAHGDTMGECPMPAVNVDKQPKVETSTIPKTQQTPTKIQKSVESIIPSFPRAMGDSGVVFQKMIPVSKLLLVETFGDFRNYPVVFPDNIKSVKLVDSKNDIVKMDLGYSFVTFETKVKRTSFNDDRYLFEVIEGDLKGSKMLATMKDSNDFSSIPNGNTLINLETKLQTSGLLSLVTFFVTDDLIKDGLGYGIDKFTEQAKNPKPIPEELEMDSDEDKFCFLLWCW